MGIFQSLFTNDDAKQAANDKIAGLNAGYSQASDLYGQGRDALITNYTAGLKPFQDLSTLGANGAQAYGDATGANGADGYQRAVDSFHAGPGFGFQLDTGLQAIDRGAASRGMVTSGNTLNAEQQYGTGLANQSYQQYVQNLQPYLQQQTTASVAGAQGQGSLYANLGNSLNSSYGNQGNLAYNTQAGIGNANAASALANGSAANNVMGAINEGIGLGTKLLGFA